MAKSLSNSFGSLQYASIAGGCMDIALIASNVEHIKFILDTGREFMPNFYFLISLLSLSIILQFSVVFFAYMVNVAEFSARLAPYRSNHSSLWQNITTVLVAVIAICNVFISVFGSRSNSAMIREIIRNNAVAAR